MPSARDTSGHTETYTTLRDLGYRAAVVRQAIRSGTAARRMNG